MRRVRIQHTVFLNIIRVIPLLLDQRRHLTYYTVQNRRRRQSDVAWTSRLSCQEQHSPRTARVTINNRFPVQAKRCLSIGAHSFVTTYCAVLLTGARAESTKHFTQRGENLDPRKRRIIWILRIGHLRPQPRRIGWVTLVVLA